MSDDYKLPPLESKGDARQLVYASYNHLKRLPDKTRQERRVIKWCEEQLFRRNGLFTYEGD